MKIDAQYAIRYYYLKFKRTCRDVVKPNIYDLWTALVETVNALARVVLGLLGALFSLLANICIKNQKKWISTETVIKEGSVHKVN